MPAYNFQPRFVEKILNGEKPHTIRRRRKHPTKVGDLIKMFVGLRTKNCRQFAEAMCVKVEPLIIYPVKHEVLIEWRESGTFVWMTAKELERLALNDGFGSVRDFFSFFLDTYRMEMLDGFEVIHWDSKRVKAVSRIT